MSDVVKSELSAEQIAEILAERKALRDRQKELTKTLQKAKSYGKDDSRHTLAVKIPVAWFDNFKELAEKQSCKVARLHFTAMREFLTARGYDCTEDEDTSDDD